MKAFLLKYNRYIKTCEYMQPWNESILAKTIGRSFITMFFLGIFAEFVVRTQLIDWEDPRLTFTNLQESSVLFDLGIFSFLVIIALDVVLSIAFYLLFNALHKPVALLMASSRLVYVAIKAFAIVGLLLARDIFSSTGINSDQIDEYAKQTMLFLKMHHYGFGVGLIFFGVHLVLLGLLLFKVNAIPKVIVWLLLIAGIGYSMNSFVGFFFDGSNVLQNVTIALFIIPMTFSELSLGIWLWVKHNHMMTLFKK